MGDRESTPADVIVAALKLARERVTGDDPEAKELRRDDLGDLATRVILYHDRPEAEGRPSAGELTEALGDPDDGNLRRALAAWG
jgi:hypothetical protein